MINALTGNTTPTTYTLRDKEGTAWLDVDNNQKIDESDAYLLLEGSKGAEYVDTQDLKAALLQLGADKKPVSDSQVIAQLVKQYADDSLQSLGVVSGPFCFGMISTYRHKQSFQLDNDNLLYTLQFDPNAPIQAYVPPAPQEPEPLPEGAVTEPTLVEREGILHWLYPGEVPQPGDGIQGSADEMEKKWTQK